MGPSADSCFGLQVVAAAHGIQDLARSVEIAREGERGGAVPNEPDVVCLAENRLYVIECTTAAG
mgnify:CR=1 FL=1